LSYSRSEMMDKMDASLSESSKKNAFADLRGMLEYTPFGKEELGFGIPIKKGRIVIGIEKRGMSVNCQNIHLSALYSLYRYAERVDKYNLTVSELYKGSALEGPFKLFRIPKYMLEEIERALNQKTEKHHIHYNEIKDEITLNHKMSSIDVVKLYGER